jgi:hypothetical protein
VKLWTGWKGWSQPQQDVHDEQAFGGLAARMRGATTTGSLLEMLKPMQEF